MGFSEVDCGDIIGVCASVPISASFGLIESNSGNGVGGITADAPTAVSTSGAAGLIDAAFDTGIFGIMMGAAIVAPVVWLLWTSEILSTSSICVFATAVTTTGAPAVSGVRVVFSGRVRESLAFSCPDVNDWASISRCCLA